MKDLIEARERWHESLPNESRQLAKLAEVLKEQIDALPVESSLRAEKILRLSRCKNELLKDEHWMTFVTSLRLGIEPLVADLRKSITQCATERRLGLVLVVNRLKLDEATGTLVPVEAEKLDEGVVGPAPIDISNAVIELTNRQHTPNCSSNSRFFPNPTFRGSKCLQSPSINMGAYYELSPERPPEKKSDYGLYANPIP